MPKSTRDHLWVQRAEAELKQLQTVIELCSFINEGTQPDQRLQGECACVLRKFIARAETKFEKGASDKKSLPVYNLQT